MRTILYIVSFTIALLLTSCAPIPMVVMKGSNMDKLELGMSKAEVIAILGTGYTVAEKRIENDVQIETLSYRDFYRDNEYYMFMFADDKLKEWYRELLPKYEAVSKQ